MSSLGNYTTGLPTGTPGGLPTAGGPRLNSNVNGAMGGGANLTPRFESNPNTNNGNYQPNGSVQITVNSSPHQPYGVNHGQWAWMDVDKHDRPKLLSLQMINKWLIEENGKDGPHTIDAITDRYRLMGVVLNHVDEANTVYNNQRTHNQNFTIVIQGAAISLDYWSKRDGGLSRYDNCFFVLKRVWVDEKYAIQTDSRVHIHNTGTTCDDRDAGYRWQVVPHACNKNSLDTKVLTSTEYYKVDQDGEHIDVSPETAITLRDNLQAYGERSVIGTYWGVGNLHEYATLPKMNDVRYRIKDTDLGRDTALLTGSTLHQFYIKITTGGDVTPHCT
jgi:hypothetical protein